ncbi:MAG TPA: glycosyltransferase [Candidatus Limiplasma sp.]|nr:glycosyltransferase [Candidatus Limiplasma sp.]
MTDVEVLLATYKPNMVFFHKLLRSVDSQTYPNITLSVVDDSADEDTYNAIAEAILTEIKSIPVRISKNEKNLGSNLTFERLTREAEGTYLAYCDQDDIWEADKIEKLVEKLEEEKAALCYSDLLVINETDKKTADSFTAINKRVRHVAGEGLFGRFLRRNSVTGCTMLIRGDVAKQALPFCNEYYVHDHWLALVAASAGRIAYVPKPLVRYRIHGGNQIGNQKLAGISDRQSYLSVKLNKEVEKFEYLLAHKQFSEDNRAIIRQTLTWVNVRKRFFEQRSLRNTIHMLGALPQDLQLILLELIVAFAPASVGRAIIRALQ